MRDSRQTEKPEQHCKPGPILGRIARQERKSRDDAAAVAEANHPRDADASLHVAAQVHGHPADDDGHGGVGAHGNEEEGGVLGARVVVDREERGGAGEGEEGGEEGEEEAVGGEVGEGGDQEGEEEGGGAGGDGVQLGFDGGVVVCFYYGGGEVGEAWKDNLAMWEDGWM